MAKRQTETWWSCSRDDEIFPDNKFESKEDAIAGAADELDLGDGHRFFVGLAVQPDPTKLFPDVRDIIAEITEEEFFCTDDVGSDWGDDFTREEIEVLQSRLEQTFREWLDEYQHWPTHFMVEQSSEHVYESPATTA